LLQKRLEKYSFDPLPERDSQSDKTSPFFIFRFFQKFFSQNSVTNQKRKSYKNSYENKNTNCKILKQNQRWPSALCRVLTIAIGDGPVQQADIHKADNTFDGPVFHSGL
jgi:transposase